MLDPTKWYYLISLVTPCRNIEPSLVLIISTLILKFHQLIHLVPHLTLSWPFQPRNLTILLGFYTCSFFFYCITQVAMLGGQFNNVVSNKLAPTLPVVPRNLAIFQVGEVRCVGVVSLAKPLSTIYPPNDHFTRNQQLPQGFSQLSLSCGLPLGGKACTTEIQCKAATLLTCTSSSLRLDVASQWPIHATHGRLVASPTCLQFHIQFKVSMCCFMKLKL